MANIAYVRVSTKEQHTDRQHQGFIDKGITIDKTFEEKLSGKDTTRPQLQAMLNYIREGDTIYVESISRLARNTKDLLTIIEQLNDKKVSFVSLKENIDTCTPQGKFILSIFAALSQLERENILQRQQEGIRIALEQGRPYGRPQAKFSNTFKSNYMKWKNGKLKSSEFMAIEHLPKSTFYKLIKRFEAVK